jgi:hypothetical protein
MSTDEEKILNTLKHDWTIASIDQHVNGYWDLEDASFDLRELTIKEQLNDGGTGQPHLTIEGHGIFLQFIGDKSYYEVITLTDALLTMTCYLQNNLMDRPIKIFTFKLTRK